MDRVFISKIIHSTQKVPVLDAIINLASELRLQVVAEGVEHLEQLIYLLKKQCNRVQGFYFFKPMPADELERILSKK
ncbi:EAL domain-containing protein [Bacillus sp. 31A1R]|uniref:EAL domain-containing protein n=1 Tax=Robertmurraya mangrovi TaxID=3098077 RepID=A0ABU5IYH7_9BACI|nr:EAL domain-containing protein [Bacillus sp. 31A1R]MDZ5472191.1 EAL domain-containing protein [Bacillus sp. 31A1R]